MGWIETSDRLPTAADTADNTVHDCVHVVFKSGVVGVRRWDNLNETHVAWHPIIAPPPYVAPVKYRTPTIADLLNGPIDCEVGRDWLPAKLRAIDVGTTEGKYMVYFVTINNSLCWQLHCRVRDK